MSLAIDCLKKACDLEGIGYESVDENGSVVILHLAQKRSVAVNTRLGMLTDAEWDLFRDKYYTYQVFGKDKLFPPTKAYIDPWAIYHFAKFASKEPLPLIAKKIITEFRLPVMVKRNSGTQAQNVYLCTSFSEVETALHRIYSKQQIEYDHVALAQAYIKPKSEYRIIVFDNQVEFSYYKPHYRTEFGGKIAPKLVADNRFQAFVDRVCQYYPIKYAGLDVVEDQSGRLWLIEVNGSPIYSSFIKANGDELVVQLFRKLMLSLNRQ